MADVEVNNRNEHLPRSVGKPDFSLMHTIHNIYVDQHLAGTDIVQELITLSIVVA